MGHGHELRTERLRLRRWREADRAAFAQMNADPEVMEHFPAPLTRRDSDLLVDRIEAGFEQHGFGLWAIEVVTTGQFVGLTGLSVPGFEAHFIPAVEVGWRLARPAWGQGYATEAARAAIDYGFTRAALPMIVSFTAAINARSRAVMERLGMARDPADDFDHPDLPPGHRLRRHVLYRISPG
ncbi:ribosomal-protein-alanine N-acetyltransferase [Micromonospora kangleipakensis]|uniref:Ribosomal-protein-alanine N-acetyltransferase n=1 Tax=Micromonospora kangleipakensis TaxID=1077942 RepID=A0A4Q8BGX0_9ACTN|nr:GNAT family N-acetyltransferase [Micromonospora kangleipakensis]RZU76711.1 ribosomal-protein-alanine N-acetyltransferase [Micromonospora kangleipakensis]